MSGRPGSVEVLGPAGAADGVVAAGESRTGPWQIALKTCHGGRSEGVRVIEIDNGAISIDVLPTRGMGLWRVRRGDRTLGWQAPAREPVHPSHVPLMEPAGLGWLDGFNELLCRCGLESNGPPEFDDAGRLLRPLHGRICNTPASRVELRVDEATGVISLRGIVEESRFHFQSLRLTSQLTIAIGSSQFSWADEVENIGGRDALMQLLYHFNVGLPLLRGGARLSAPVHTVAPLTSVAADAGIDTWNIIPPPSPGSSEQVYVADLAADASGNTRVLLSGLSDNEGISLAFNKQSLPCFTLWRNTPHVADGYVVGLEPGTNFPNPRTFENEHGRVRKLAPGQKWRTEVSAAWLQGEPAIAEAEAAIRTLQGDIVPELLKAPRKDWTAGA